MTAQPDPRRLDGLQHLIKARTEDARKRAKDRGVRFARLPKLTPLRRQKALERLANGESQTDVARAYNDDPVAICRLAASGAMPDNF